MRALHCSNWKMNCTLNRSQPDVKIVGLRDALGAGGRRERLRREVPRKRDERSKSPDGKKVSRSRFKKPEKR